jgi:glyoxalase family protein
VNDYDGLLKWKRRLIDLEIPVRGPYDRKYFMSIYFDDPDGGIVEIATKGPGFAVDEPAETMGQADQMPPTEHTHTARSEDEIARLTWPEAIPHITAEMALLNGIHHITAIAADIMRTNEFYSGLLGLPLVKRTFNFDDLSSRHWYWAIDGGRTGGVITYFERDPAKTRQAVVGAGTTHHFALAVADEDEQLRWREKIMAAGITVSPVRDRTYFKSIYTRDPDGHIVEIATIGPGFDVDEPLATLGGALMLPPDVESQRDQLERTLRPLTVPTWSTPI